MIYDNEVITQMIRDHFKSKDKTSDDGSGVGWDSYLIEIESVHDKWGNSEVENKLGIFYNITINTKSSQVISIDRNLYLSKLSNKFADIRDDKLNKLGI